MRLYTSTLALLAFFLMGSMNLLLANHSLPLETTRDHSIVLVHVNMPIVGTKNIATNVFYYDIVGLESDATAKHLTSGVTKDIHTLITDLKLDKNYVKIGIKLKWGGSSRYFLFNRKELTYGEIDLNKGKN
ncbi:MAG: hypothetical protein ACI9VN_001338 [Patescibacteria group bacterium]|jgi:hypothetical protein